MQYTVCHVPAGLLSSPSQVLRHAVGCLLRPLLTRLAAFKASDQNTGSEEQLIGGDSGKGSRSDSSRHQKASRASDLQLLGLTVGAAKLLSGDLLSRVTQAVWELSR